MKILNYDLPLEPKYAISPLSLILLCVICFFTLDPVAWRTVDSVFTTGEYYRLLSGNFLHTNLNHLLLNCAGVLLIWFLHGEHYSIGRYYTVLLCCCIGSSIGWVVTTELSNSVGLSGALHGMMIYGALRDIRMPQFRQVGWLLLIGVSLKVGYENLLGASDDVVSLINANIAVKAHLFGAITGLVIGLLANKKA